jgi:hypothetical protein
MTLLRRLIHGRVDVADHRQLQQEAAARGVSMTACVGDILREYFALRTEMASVMTSPGQPGERHTGLIHSLLARSKERLVATLEARTTELTRRLVRLEAMLDGLVWSYMLHTEDLTPESFDRAFESANRRHGNYERWIARRVAAEDPAGPGPGSGERTDEKSKESAVPVPAQSGPAPGPSGESTGATPAS